MGDAPETGARSAGAVGAAPAQVEPAGATPAWLTGVLRAAGTLPRGRVRRVRAVASGTQAGTRFARLEVAYSAGAPAGLPASLFLKLPRADRPAAFTAALGAREVAFYARIAPAAAVPVPRCLAAAEAKGGGWHLLLEDVTATHGQPEWPVPPPLEDCRRAADALAALHAAWWGHPRLEGDLGQPVSAAEVEAGITTTTALVERFVHFLGDRLTPAGRACYDHAVAALPSLWAWYGRRTAKTLCHGDAHAWNVLFPRRAAGPVYLCDWQTWRPGIGALDLATLMVLDWSPARRAGLECGLVRRYHARLEALGVRGYACDACWRDYRWAALNALFTPPWRWDKGTAARYWWPHLEAALAAFDDLGCAALAGRAAAVAAPEHRRAAALLPTPAPPTSAPDPERLASPARVAPAAVDLNEQYASPLLPGSGAPAPRARQSLRASHT
jgi:hypothetical protein